MKVSVIAPVRNEVDFIGYSVMSVLPHVHEIIYAVAPSSDDGTIDLLRFIQSQYAKKKLRLISKVEYDFKPSDEKAYNQSFNDLIAAATGNAVWFLHPDMVCTNPEAIPQIHKGPLAWFTSLTSYAGDLQTTMVGRATKWKNIIAREFGVHYAGKYGSQNEDFYFRDITGDAYHHYGENFTRYPYEVEDSGVCVNHYCEMKDHNSRLNKMKHCMKTLMPEADKATIDGLAAVHPRVTLKDTSRQFGRFEFVKTTEPIPSVFTKYGDEFKSFKKEVVRV